MRNNSDRDGGTIPLGTAIVHSGEVSEWPIVQHWKCCVPQGTVGSNPTLSASKLKQGCILIKMNIGMDKNFITPHIIVYFDILGYRSEVTKNESSFFTMIVIAMGAFHRSMHTTYTAFSKMFKRNIIKMNTIDQFIRYKLFSDNCLMYTALSADEEQNKLRTFLLIDACLNIQCHFSRCGIKLRGVITKGNLYADKYIVYGSGVIKAVELEETANFPIIILDKGIKIPKKLADIIPIKKHKNIKYLDYLEYYYRRYLSQNKSHDNKVLFSFLKNHKKLIKAIPVETGKTKTKKRFLIKYHNQFCLSHNLKQFLIVR